MINLMPPGLQEQIKYAKMNRIALGYLRATVAVVVVLGGVFFGAHYLLSMQINQSASDVSSRLKQISQERNSLLPVTQDASERLNAISYVQQTQTHYAALINDLASVFPQGVTINTLTLTGNQSKPVSLAVTAKSYDDILALRNSLVTSPRVAAADIVSINCQAATSTTPISCNGVLIIGFKPGEAQ